MPSAQRHAAPVRRAARLSEVERQLPVAAVVTLGVIDAVDATVDASSHAADLAVARAAAARVGGDAVPLAGGSLLVLVEARGTAADQATMSVRVVRAIVDALPRAHAGIAAGLSAAAAKGLAGDLLARALGLAKQGPGIHVDRAVADLLGGEHAMAARGDGFELAPTKDAAVDRVLGRVLPFVGRDKEMALLEAVVAEASDEGAPRSALVLAPPGTGKSRLGRELAARLRAKEHVALLETVAHATEAGAVHSLLAGLVRSAAKLGAKPHAGDRDRMRLYVASLPGIEQPSRLTDFLAWMAGWRALDDGAGPELVAAVGDPDLMARGVRRSLREWLASASRVGTVVLLLEDLHWGDAASIARLDDVMRALPSSPIVLIGLARPEAKETLPLSLHMLTEVRLEGLGARAAERIVRALLGADESAAVVADVVERARGNPLFLGELSRFLREGRGDELPASVHAVIEARISRLSPECRRVLRAASVLGERVTPAAVASVAGEEVRAIDRALATLSETEILRAEETEGTEETHRFVHALVREVAYATLVGDDRARAHARAAAFLEQAAAPDPRAIARHWELAGEPKRAILHLVEAADYAVEVGAERDAFEIAQHGIALGAEGVELGHLAGMMTIQALAANANPTEAARWSEVALDNVPATHETWPLVAGVAAFGAVASGRGAELGARVVRTWLAAGVRVTHNRRHYLSSLILVLGLARSGHRRELAMILASTAEPRKEALAEIATYEVAHCADALYNAGGVGEIDRRIARARSPAQATDDDLVLGFCDYYEARVRGVATLSAGVAHDLAATAERRAGTTYQATLAGIQTAAAIARALTDARAIDAIRPYVESADKAVSDLARYGVVVALIRAGRLDDARRAIAEAEVVAPSARSSLAVQAARITALEGRPADALEELGRVEPLLAEHAFVWQWEYWYATKIQALVDVGRTSDARVALGLARARLAVTLDGASPALVSLAHAAVEPVVALDQLARELDG
ncbi:MAG: AAA family ATPase [Polyangiaceae bacterium]